MRNMALAQVPQSLSPYSCVQNLEYTYMKSKAFLWCKSLVSLVSLLELIKVELLPMQGLIALAAY
jgi:hypothetical protein